MAKTGNDLDAQKKEKTKSGGEMKSKIAKMGKGIGNEKQTCKTKQIPCMQKILFLITKKSKKNVG